MRANKKKSKSSRADTDEGNDRGIAICSYGEILLDESNHELYIYASKHALGKKLIIGDNMEILPSNHRECMFISGPSGSGKSTLARAYMRSFAKLQKQDIYVFCPQSVAYDYESTRAYIISDEKDRLNLSIDDVPDNSLVVFDDCDLAPDSDSLAKFRDTLLEHGRHKNIYVIITSHLLMMPSKLSTNRIYNECSLITIFPKSGNLMNMTRMLQTQIGLSGQQIKKIMEIPSRWITIHKNYPQYCVWQNGVCMFS